MLKLRQTLAAAAALLAFSALPDARAAAQPRIPLTLQEAIQTALAGNLTYRQSAMQIASATASLRQAAAARGVNLALQDSSQYVNPVARLSTPFGSLPFSPSNVNSTPLVSARFMAYDGGLSAARIAEAEAQLARAQSTVNRSRQQTIDSVATAYFQLAAALALQQVAKRSVAVSARHLKDARERLSAGTVPRADVLRAQTDLADQQVAQIDADNQEAVAQASLDQIMGVPQADLHVPTGSLASKAPTLDLDALIRASQVDRPDLSAAIGAVTAAKAAVSAAQAAHRPQVTVTASDGNVQPAVEAGFHNQFTVGLNAVWTLFDGGYTNAAVARAQAGVTSAALAVANLQSTIELQVRQAYLNVRTDEARITAAIRLVTFADENLRVAQLRASGGVGTPLELQDAALHDRDAHRALVQSQVNLQSALVDLESATGSL